MNARRCVAILALGVLTLSLAGCFDPFSPRVLGRGKSTSAPIPNSPSGLLRMFEWAYNNRDISVYRTVFTDDYRFVFAASDSAGNRYRDVPFTRADELASAENLFNAASNISLTLNRSFVISDDPRPGMNPYWHKNIRTQVTLNITTIDGGQTNVLGYANFFLVRGDSAAIPTDLGFQPDSNRWYMDRWEDETVPGTPLVSPALARLAADGRLVLPAATTAATSDIVTWGELKVLYR